MNNKYRSIDTSQNIIISTKNIVGNYIPYRTNLKNQPSFKSLKKASDPSSNLKNCRAFEKNKFPKRVLSKNDRLDLYLSGGQPFDKNNNIQPQNSPYKITSQAAFDNGVFFRGGKVKRKEFMSTVKAQHNVFKSQMRTFYKSSHQVKLNEGQQKNRSLNQVPIKISVRKEFPKRDKIKRKQSRNLNFRARESSSQNQQYKIQQKGFSPQTGEVEQMNQILYKSANNLQIKDGAENENKDGAENENIDEGKDSKNDKTAAIISIFRKRKRASLNHNNASQKSDISKQFLEKSDKRLSESAQQNKNGIRKSNKNLLQIKREEKAQSLKKPLFYLNQKQLANITAESFIVTQYPSGQVLTGNYYKKFAQIASLTKIMTFYAAYQISVTYSVDLQELVQIDQQVQSVSGTSAQLYAGDIFTAKQLLYGLMLPSGNDAAIALGKWAGGILLKKQWQCLKFSQTERQKQKEPMKLFLSFCNKLAKDLNMNSTKFFNCHGLPNSQSGSTPYQLSILINECLKIQIFREVVSTKVYTCYTRNTIGKRQAIWENTNKLLRRRNFIGVKTGVTVTAGPCLATCYQSGDKIFIVVLLRTTKLSRRFKETRMILGIALSKLNSSDYAKQIKQIFKQDKELDSDNSQDQMEFQFDKSDAKEMAKRNKILTYQM